MTYLAKPKLHHPDLPSNALGFTRRDYEGTISTLCAGCGHDSISAAIIQACLELDIEPHRVAKLSGIGCSSKTPTYFLGKSHGFNSVHGRMPSVLTGANLANRDLIYLGVSGDGDSASIGLGQFAHVMRRGVNMIYIVENNGVYGLTKGQFSATADKGSKSKKRRGQHAMRRSTWRSWRCMLGATFVARSFSGDKAQLVPLIKAALAHQGAAFIDVDLALRRVQQPRRLDQELRLRARAQRGGQPPRLHPAARRDHRRVRAGERAAKCAQHDGSMLRLRKLHADYDPTDKIGAMSYVQAHRARGEVVTGLLYLESDGGDLHDAQHTVATPLNALSDAVLVPGSAALAGINADTALSAAGARRTPGRRAGSAGRPSGGPASHPTPCRASSRSRRHHDHAVVRQRQRQLRSGRQRLVDRSRDHEQFANRAVERVFHESAQIGGLAHCCLERRATEA